MVLPAYSQCGGINNAPSQDQSGNFAWNTTECSQDFQCLSNSNPWYWQVSIRVHALHVYQMHITRHRIILLACWRGAKRR